LGLVAILNSTLINYWFYKTFILDDALFPYQRVSQLSQIPVTKYFDNIYLVQLSKVLHYKYNEQLYGVINAIVFNLYPLAHMKERSIDVLEFVERDIASVWPKQDASAQKQDAFDTLSDTEKEQVIEQLHQKWTDPDNEVVKRMGMFKERSPDILKVIMES